MGGWLGGLVKFFRAWVSAAAATLRTLPATLLRDSCHAPNEAAERVGGSFRPGIYHMCISFGDRVRSPNKGYYAPAALGEERVRVIDCGDSLGVCVIPPRAMYVPGFKYCIS